MLIKLGDKEAKAWEDEREGGGAVVSSFLSESKRTASAKAK